MQTYVIVCFHYTTLCECAFLYTSNVPEKTQDAPDMVDNTESLLKKNKQKNGKINRFR